MDLLWTIVVGGLIGWVASLVMKTDGQMGILMNIGVGIVGAILGSWLAPKLGLGPTDRIGSILVALGGAILVIVILKALKVMR